MKKLLKRWVLLARLLWPRRQRIAAVTAISDVELQARFRAAPGSPLWEATLAVIEQKIIAGMDDAVDERLDDRTARWRLGRIDGLIELREELRERERLAKEEREEKLESKAS
jgi:hypothetical protein